MNKNQRRLLVFNHVSLDGYFTGVNGDFSWAHRHADDPEWNAFVAGNSSSGGILLFGRVTYDLMAGYWPTKFAADNDPALAAHMNNLQKIVFSRTMEEASWQNTRLIKSDLAGEISRMKKEPGHDMVVLGSGSIVSQLAQEGLVDEYQLIVNPVVLGSGKNMFAGVNNNLQLKHTKTRSFANGNVLLCYELL